MARPAPLPPADLRELLARLAANGELVEVDVEVDSRLEVAEIHRRVIAAGGPALLFRRVKSSPFRLVTNLFGNARRVEIAFGRPHEFVADLVRFAQELPPPSLGKFWRARGLLARLARVGMRRSSRAPITEVVEAPRLDELPLTQSWSQDGGCFATLPLVYTEALDADGRPGGPGNLGIYRMQRHGDRATGMHWQIAKGGGFHHHAAEARGLDLPTTVFFGGPPAALAAALAPLPENVPELLLASLLLGRRLPLVHDARAPHALLADAEFALVGKVRAGVRRPEGPFGDHYGYYSLTHDFPVFEVEQRFRRRDAILPATVVGKPRQEDFFLGDFLQGLLAPLFPLAMPSVVDLWSYGETGYHALAAAVVRDRYKREAMVSAFRILGEGQLSLTKFLLLTDQQIDLHDFKKLLVHVLARTRIETDLFVFPNLSMDTLDYAGAKLNQGSKGVLLGLGEPVRTLPTEFSGAAPAGVRALAPFCAGCLVVEGPLHTADPGFAERLAADRSLGSWPLVVLTDDVARATASSVNFLWTTFTRFDPARDLFAAEETLVERQLVRRPPLVIDARMKGHLPDELFCDPVTRATVDRRWAEYFPRGMAAGDSDRGHLDAPQGAGGR